MGLRLGFGGCWVLGGGKCAALEEDKAVTSIPPPAGAGPRRPESEGSLSPLPSP